MRLEKSKNSHGLNQMGKGQPDFMLKSDSSSGAFEADLDVDLYPLTPTIRPDRLELLTYRRPAAEKKPPNAMPSLTEQSSDFSLKALALEGRKMSLLLDFKTNASPGKYLYTVYVRVPSLNVFATPQWAKDFSSANPTPAKDPNKTLNLEKFITDLLSASVAVRQPNVVKLCLTIDRR
jgi:hypothetical protein